MRLSTVLYVHAACLTIMSALHLLNHEVLLHAAGFPLLSRAQQYQIEVKRLCDWMSIAAAAWAGANLIIGAIGSLEQLQLWSFASASLTFILAAQNTTFAAQAPKARVEWSSGGYQAAGACLLLLLLYAWAFYSSPEVDMDGTRRRRAQYPNSKPPPPPASRSREDKQD